MIEQLDAIRNKNDDVKIRSAIGLAYYEINKKEDSLSYFNFALELDRNYLPALQYKALILMENDNYEEALNIRLKVFKVSNEIVAKTYFALGNISFLMK